MRGLRAGVLHLDLPIAAGIALVYLLSLLQLRQGRGDVAYFDTLDVFICLMLAGRLLQDRVLERNRRFLLEDDGAEGIAVRVLRAGRVAIGPAPEVRAGEQLVVAPGDLVPVDATLLDAQAAIRTDWITGEADVQPLAAGALVPAGAVNAGRAPACSRRAPPSRTRRSSRCCDGPRRAREKVRRTNARGCARSRLGAGRAGDRDARLSSLASSRARHRGERGGGAARRHLPVRDRSGDPARLRAHPVSPAPRRLLRAERRLLDRLARVKKLLFDKTGTLTLGRLELADPAAIGALDGTARDVAYNLAARSSHPASACLARALEGRKHLRPRRCGRRIPGQGLEWRRADGVWRLGRADWATFGRIAGPTPLLARDGATLAALGMREVLRPDAARQIAELTRVGYETWLLSGDSLLRVQELAADLCIPASALWRHCCPRPRRRSSPGSTPRTRSISATASTTRSPSRPPTPPARRRSTGR
jgi:Cu2+-exporting ATPase